MSGAIRVLVVEDEVSIATSLRRSLEREGYLVASCETGGEVPDLVRTWNPNVVLLDLVLPDMDGIDVARRIRAHSRVPIIMVSARATEADRVRGLESGADDYVVKPFGVNELIARIRVVSRRAELNAAAPMSSSLTLGSISLDTQHRVVSYDGIEIDLSAKESEILRMLMSNAGTVVRNEDIARSVWGLPLAQAWNTLRVHVSWLRKKLHDDSEGGLIETVRGVGFRFRAPDA